MTRVTCLLACASVATLSVAVMAGAQESATAPRGDPGDRYCLYPSMVGGAPEIGLLPCDVARPYTIGVWDGDSARGEPDASASPSTETAPPLAMEWHVAGNGRARPTLQGYVVDLDGRVVTGLRLRIDGIDASGALLFSARQRIAAAVPGQERIPFEVTVPRPAASYRITVEREVIPEQRRIEAP